jgi:small GTP-binding protein
MGKQSSTCIAILGDPAVGKTSLLHCYTTDEFVSEHKPTIFDHYEAMVSVNQEPMMLEFWDTSALDQYSNLRNYSISKSEAFFICFNVVDRDSFKSVSEKYVKELTED